MSGSNSVSTGSARSAKDGAGRTPKTRPAWVAEAAALSHDDHHSLAIDALAIAVYRASYHGHIAPSPVEVLYQLLRLGWMVCPIPNEPDDNFEPTGETDVPIP